jgi:prophage DNA circulation protein
MSWKDQLAEGSFRGVEFAFQAIDDGIGRRQIQHTYQYRDGADIEDLGAEPRTTKVKAIFFGPQYEDGLGELIRVVDEGKPGEFRHPILGAWQARVARSPVHFDSGAYDVATVELEVVEDGTDKQVPDLFSVTAMELEAEEAVLEIEEAWGELSYDLPEVPSVISEIRSFIASAQAELASIVDKVNRVRSRVDRAIAAARKLGDVRSWPLVVALKKAVHTVQRLAKSIRDIKPPVILKRLEAAMPVSLLAHSMYGTGTKRADEILRLNKIKNPFIVPRGTELKVYAR